MKILLTGGGTGGHIYPLAAVAQKLKEAGGPNEIELYYFGNAGIYEPYLSGLGIKTARIISSKLRRYFDVRNIIDGPKFLISLLQAFWKVFWLMPDVLFSKGGPGSLPVVIACWFYHIPVLIHESDAAASLTSKISSRFARRIAISFAAAEDFFLAGAGSADKALRLKGKIALTGNPVRNFLLNPDGRDPAAAKTALGFNSEEPLILVLGGSQGAQAVNDFFLDAAGELLDEFQILHQTGENNFAGFKSELDAATKNLLDFQRAKYKPYAYLDGKNLFLAYAAADLVVARAGSGLIFEIAAFGKPAILIPLPDSAQDHQLRNAVEYSKTGAAIFIEQENLKTNIFFVQLKKILSSPELIRSMSVAAKNFSKPLAAQTIAEEIVKIGTGQ